MVGRIGDAAARDASIVSDKPQSAFPPHVQGGGEEFRVLDHGFRTDGEAFGRQSWLRLPADAAIAVRSDGRGCRAWIKRGHLALP